MLDVRSAIQQKGRQKDKSERSNLADLCLQMAITNKDRNLEYSKIEERDKIVQKHFLDTAMEKVVSVI